MGVKRIMETFFAGMQDQSMSGFGGRIVNTPMGPFRWNDTMQLWENVNNGMIMNNISFQDSMMMMDYSTMGGGADNPLGPAGCNYSLQITIPVRGITIDSENESDWFYIPFTNYTTKNTCGSTCYVELTNISGTNIGFINNFSFRYKLKYPGTRDDIELPSGSNYSGLSFGITGSKIYLLPGSTIGYGLEFSPTNFAIAIQYNNPTPGSCFGDVAFTMRLRNESNNDSIINTINVNYNTADRIPTLTGTFGNVLGITTGEITRFASTSGPTLLANASAVTFSDINVPISISLSPKGSSGTVLSSTSLRYSINSTAGFSNYVSAFTINNGDSLRVGFVSPKDVGTGLFGAGTIELRNVSVGLTLTSLPWSYTYGLIPGGGEI